MSAAGHLVDTERLGTATSATVVLDAAQIAASFASFGAMSITVKAGSAAAALQQSRWFVPLSGATAGADVVQFVALSDITFSELNKVQSGASEDRERAMAVLLTQLIVASGLTALSVQGVRNLRALSGKPLEIVDQNGKNVLRLVGQAAPSSVGEPEPVASTTRAPTHDVSTSEPAPAPAKNPVTATGHVPEAPRAPADQAVEIVKKHKGSVREALRELNRQGFTQAQMREALEAAWRSTGRDTAGALTAQDGTLILLSRRRSRSQVSSISRRR